MKKQMHIYYGGMVQGVGFRFTAEALAKRLGIVGWVKNLSDGRVEFVGEGEEKILKGFLSKIKNGSLRNYIQDEDISWSEATGEFEDFGIRFW